MPGTSYFIVRTSGAPATVAGTVRQTLTSIDATVPILGIVPLSVAMRNSLQRERLLARLASGFGILALVLAAIGLYGVMSYAITRRTGEIGLRVALGAESSQVVRMVLFDALRLVAIGVVIGLPLALAATRLLRAQLHGVESNDPVAIGAALAVLGASAVVAVLRPALRASRVPPIVALRQE
jgi:ABC-type lipoprotein release transport system permease subunit